jgi:hypothetical protein
MYTMFNYIKTGFVKQPVDFYSRPLWLSEDQHRDVSLSLNSSSNKVLLENVIVITAVTLNSVFSVE